MARMHVAAMSLWWRKSSRSSSQGGNCVEVAAVSDRVLVAYSSFSTATTWVCSVDTTVCVWRGTKCGSRTETGMVPRGCSRSRIPGAGR